MQEEASRSGASRTTRHFRLAFERRKEKASRSSSLRTNRHLGLTSVTSLGALPGRAAGGEPDSSPTNQPMLCYAMLCYAMLTSRG